MNRVTRRRGRWIAVASLAGILLAGVVVWGLFSTHHLDPWQFLAHVVQVEQTGTDEYSVQTLGWSLAILGRDDEVRAINFRSNFNQRPATVEFDALKTKAVPWDDGIRSIAATSTPSIESSSVPPCRRSKMRVLRTTLQKRSAHWMRRSHSAATPSAVPACIHRTRNSATRFAAPLTWIRNCGLRLSSVLS